MSNRDSNFVKIIKEICDDQGIEINSHVYDWVFELDKGEMKNSIFGYQFGINTSSSTSICTDKAAASQVLLRHDVPSVMHHLFMSPKLLHVTDEKYNWSRINELMDEYKVLVCKPNDGTGGDNVFKVTSPIELEQVAQTIFATANAMAVSIFEEIEFEYRVVVLDGKARLAFFKEVQAVTGDGESTLRQLVADYILENSNAPIPSCTTKELAEVVPAGVQKRFNWKHNLGQGAIPCVVEIGQDLEQLAISAVKATGITFASVDIIKTAEGLKVLEINSGVMLENFSHVNEQNYEIAKSIYRDAILMMFR